jgi:hypothetical protein
VTDEHETQHDAGHEQADVLSYLDERFHGTLLRRPPP